jgi:hypothetical protein
MNYRLTNAGKGVRLQISSNGSESSDVRREIPLVLRHLI